MTGFVPPADLPRLYNMADLFVFPSLYEGFGVPPLEAMACGVPVMVSDRGALPEIAGKAAVTVNPTDVEGMAGAMRDVLRNAALRSRLKEAGVRHAARFSWQRTADQTESFYRDVLRTRAAAAGTGTGAPFRGAGQDAL
jgi:glycosyltransferase involved in cell wall biosynthesis